MVGTITEKCFCLFRRDHNSPYLRDQKEIWLCHSGRCTARKPHTFFLKKRRPQSQGPAWDKTRPHLKEPKRPPTELTPKVCLTLNQPLFPETHEWVLSQDFYSEWKTYFRQRKWYYQRLRNMFGLLLGKLPYSPRLRKKPLFPIPKVQLPSLHASLPCTVSGSLVVRFLFLSIPRAPRSQELHLCSLSQVLVQAQVLSRDWADACYMTKGIVQVWEITDLYVQRRGGLTLGIYFSLLQMAFPYCRG